MYTKGDVLELGENTNNVTGGTVDDNLVNDSMEVPVVIADRVQPPVHANANGTALKHSFAALASLVEDIDTSSFVKNPVGLVRSLPVEKLQGMGIHKGATSLDDLICVSVHHLNPTKRHFIIKFKAGLRKIKVNLICWLINV